MADLSKRHSLETAPQLAESRVLQALAGVVQSLDVGLLLTDDRGVIRFANAALDPWIPESCRPLTGRLRNDLLHAWEAIFQGPALHWLRRVQPGFASSEAAVLEPLDGTLSACRWSVAPTGDWLSETFRPVAAANDGDRQIIEFLALTAHDLKTPVTSIKGYAQLTARQVASDDARVQRNLRAVTDQADRLVGLIDGIVDIGRLRLGRLEMRPQAIDLAALLREATQPARSRGPYERIRLQVTPDPLPAVLDGSRLRRVCESLTDFALKQTGSRVPVDVIAERHDDVLAIDICVGDEPDPLLARADVPPPGLQPGGFGLPLARQVIEAHGGTITFAIQSGHGLRVAIRLPYHEPPA